MLCNVSLCGRDMQHRIKQEAVRWRFSSLSISVWSEMITVIAVVWYTVSWLGGFVPSQQTWQLNCSGCCDCDSCAWKSCDWRSDTTCRRRRWRWDFSGMNQIHTPRLIDERVSVWNLDLTLSHRKEKIKGSEVEVRPATMLMSVRGLLPGAAVWAPVAVTSPAASSPARAPTPTGIAVVGVRPALTTTEILF